LISILQHFDSKRQAILEIDASDYVKDEILSQYNDERVLHSVTFYSKSMILAECNYLLKSCLDHSIKETRYRCDVICQMCLSKRMMKEVNEESAEQRKEVLRMTQRSALDSN